MNKHLVFIFLGLVFLSSCSVQKRVEKVAGKYLLKDSALATAHVGIALYNTAGKKFIYNHDGEKYFVPASNTKILTCYAAMKYLGDSLVGLKYETNNDGSITIQGTGDPTFLHPDFKKQPVFYFLKNTTNHISYLRDDFLSQFTPLGEGWNWDDYNEDYAAERSELPVYGNVVRVNLTQDTVTVIPSYFFSYSFIWLNQEIRRRNELGAHFKIVRPFENNDFHGVSRIDQPTFSKQSIPFKTRDLYNPNIGKQLFLRLLEDTLHKYLPLTYMTDVAHYKLPNIIHSQPTDSLLKIMMHRSDNFFAEQTLLMVSNELLGVMSDKKIIDTLLKTDFKDLPQMPNWVDGSGLSRYNLITPQDEVKVLEKMKNNFRWNRITTIFSTGGTGTLRTRYKNYVGKIYAKTGSLSDVIALSGFITTNKNHSYIFSVMINNSLADETQVRDKIEKFISTVIEKF